MYAPYKLFALIEIAKQFSIPAHQILRGTGLDLKMLEDAEDSDLRRSNMSSPVAM